MGRCIIETIDGKRKLQSSIGKLLNKKADKIIFLSGLLGTYDEGGNQVIIVPARPSFVYVRIGGNYSETIQAFNTTVAPNFDTKVLVTKATDSNYYIVIGLDIPQYPDWGGNPYYMAHALQHMFGEGVNEGSDPVFIYKRQLLQPLGVHPNPTGSMSAVVEPDFYVWNNTIKYFPGADTADFSNLVPTGAYSRFLTIYLDGNAETLGYATGTEFYPSFYITGTVDYIPEVSPIVGIPLSAVYLSTGMTSVDWDSLFDLRNFLNQGGMGINTHGLDPIDGYHSGTLRANQVTITDIGNFFTGTIVEDALQEIDNKTFLPRLHHIDPSFGYHTGSLPASKVSVVDAQNYYTGTVAEDVLQEIGQRILTGSISVTHQIVFTTEGVLAVQTGKIRIYNELGLTQNITKVFCSVNTAPVGQAIIVDVNKNGTSIFTAGNRPQIAAGANTGFSTNINTPTFSPDDYLQMDIDQIGSSTKGSDLTVHMILT